MDKMENTTKKPVLKQCPHCGNRSVTTELYCKTCLGNPKLIEVRR